MKDQIEITATMTKTNIDAKKATITLELEYESWNQIPSLARMTEQIVNTIIYPSQISMSLEG